MVYITCIAPLLAGRNLVHELCGLRLWEIRLQYDYRASDDVKGLYKAGTPMRAYEDYPSEALLLPRRINRVYRYYNDTVWALAARIEELWPADKTA